MSAPQATMDPVARSTVGMRVEAPARLHLGFLDPAGTLGRRFGSLGLVIEGSSTVVELRPSGTDRATADDADGAAALPSAREHLQALRRATGRHEPLHLRLVHSLPAHAGLGSGTQLALAIGCAWGLLLDEALTSHDIARITGRGRRSGVGIAGFDQGGLLLDGGPGADGSPAPLLARFVLPPAWRVVLAFDPRVRGLAGEAERSALATLPPLARECAAEICHEVLMRVLPGAAAGEFVPFAAGVTRMQTVLGRHFAPAQQGRAWCSADVGRVIEWIGACTPAAIGQSSWGPTGFAIVPSAADAEAAIAAARGAGVVDASLRLRVVRARDHGALAVPLPPA